MPKKLTLPPEIDDETGLITPPSPSSTFDAGLNVIFGTYTGFIRTVAGVVQSDASTTDLTEGTNLYFTDGRADARIAAQKGAANGIATLDAGNKLPVGQLPAQVIQLKSVDYTAVDADDIIVVDATAAPRAITIPSAVTRTRPIWVRKNDTSANAITVTAAAGNIDGDASAIITGPGISIGLMPDGANYVVFSVGRP